MRQWVLIAFLIGVALPGSASAGSLPPFDEAGHDPGFKRFRAQFLEIVQKRDLSSLEKHLHPNIRMSLGNGRGIPAAVRIMRNEPSRWKILEQVLRGGGKFKTFSTADGPERMFFAPYTYFAELGDGDSPFEIAVVTGENVNVRATPSRTARVIKQLSNWVVHVPSPIIDEKPWIKIRIPQGSTGYVHASHIARPTDFRAGFEMHEGNWKLRVFLAGD